MGELQRAVERLGGQEAAADRYRRERQELSHRRSQEFIDTTHGIGTTALYRCESIRFQGAPTGFNRSTNHTRHEFHFVGQGWIVTQRTSDGPDTHLIVLDTNDTYDCTRQGLYKAERDGSARIEH